MMVEQIARAVFWTLAVTALSALAAVCGCLYLAAAGDPGPAALLSIVLALQIVVDLFCMLTVRNGALEVSHHSTAAPRLLLIAILSVECVIYALVARVTYAAPVEPWVRILALLRAGTVALAWIGTAAALWISRDTPNNPRGKREPDRSTDLPDDEMPTGWDEATSQDPAASATPQETTAPAADADSKHS